MTESITTIEELQARVDELEDIIIKAFPWIGVRPNQPHYPRIIDS